MRNSASNLFASGGECEPERQPRKGPALASDIPIERAGLIAEQEFHRILAMERRRAERSLRPFVLMLLGSRAAKSDGTTVTKRLPMAVAGAVRQTDHIGWYAQGGVLGVIFTEVASSEKGPRTEILRTRIVRAVEEKLGLDQASSLIITVYVFPENSIHEQPGTGASPPYPEISASSRKLPALLKRGIDIAGSSILLVVLSPLFAAIAVAIRLSSEGPIVFKQQRVGQFGKPFEFLKFRSMLVNNDPRIHREYVERFITARTENLALSREAATVYKITDDPRVTPVGRFLRKTSLDELPQLWNVLRGELSLVGPRPPLPYEFNLYACWHRRRVFDVKPGLTGLWQVSGRSRTTFDEMVRLDLRYSQNWSLWLDLKILLATPRAVVNGDGAF